MSQNKPKKGDLKKRFFVAVMPPTDICEKLAKIESSGENYWKWKRKQDMHISLAFPGFESASQEQNIISALEKVDLQSFDVEISGLDHFYWDAETGNKNLRDDCLITAFSPASTRNLKSLIDKIKKALNDQHFKSGMRNPPHITLAKAPTHDRSRLDEVAEKGDQDYKGLSWTCNSFFLVETLSKDHEDHPENKPADYDGSRYRVIKEFKLD